MNIFRTVRKPRNSLLDKMVNDSKEKYNDSIDYCTAVIFCFVASWGLIDQKKIDSEKTFHSWWFEIFDSPAKDTVDLARKSLALLRDMCRKDHIIPLNDPLIKDVYVLMGAYPYGELTIEHYEEYVVKAFNTPHIYWAILGTISIIISERHRLRPQGDILLNCRKEGFIPSQFMRFNLLEYL